MIYKYLLFIIIYNSYHYYLEFLCCQALDGSSCCSICRGSCLTLCHPGFLLCSPVPPLLPAAYLLCKGGQCLWG